MVISNVFEVSVSVLSNTTWSRQPRFEATLKFITLGNGGLSGLVFRYPVLPRIVLLVARVLPLDLVDILAAGVSANLV